jgi:Na+/melibiose symporter-like transporter
LKSLVDRPDSTLPQAGVNEVDSGAGFGRSFRYLWLSTTLVDVGGAISMFAVPVIAIQAMGASESDIGLLRMTSAIPVVLFSYLAGTLADSLDNRTTLMCRGMACALLALSIPAAISLGGQDIWILALILFLLSTADTLGSVSETAILPRIIRKDQALEANRRFGLSSSLVNLTAPGLSGWLVVAAGASLAMGANALCFALSALLVSRIALTRAGPAAERDPAEAAPHFNGFAELLRNQRLLLLALAYVAWMLITNICITLRVFFALEELGIRPDMLGLLYALTGIGGLVSVAAAKFMTGFTGKIPLLAASIAVASLSLWAMGALTPSPTGTLAFGLCLAGTAFGVTLSTVLLRTLIYVELPGEGFGRTLGAIYFLGSCAVPVSAGVVVLAAESLGSGALIQYAASLALPLVVGLLLMAARDRATGAGKIAIASEVGS